MATKKPMTAYFCMEYGLDSRLKFYAGGLGILAGDYLKGARDNNLPMIAIGLKWKQGYTDQYVNEDGSVYNSYLNREYDTLEDTGILIPVKIRENQVMCKVWKTEAYGNVTLYLLDTDIPENKDQWITGQLYGWFAEERVAQEMVLGIGGIRLLRHLKQKIDVYHFNEGHAVLAGLELIREKMDSGSSFDSAVEKTRQEIVFTTHTPIKQGNEEHSLELLRYMGAHLGLSIEQMNRIGNTPFNMTVAALRLSRFSNGVAQLHGVTARKMWKDVDGASEIIGITNGIHVPTWVDSKIQKSVKTPSGLWKRHMELKNELIQYVFDKTGARLKKDVLLLGFTRRAAPYKRSDLIFRTGSRVMKAFQAGKIQIVFSGKAHPLDDEGKRIVENLVRMSREMPDQVVFLENYDMEIGAKVTRGVDVWLNNPRRPLEACGTSGMKASMNGVLNLSVLDGWWPEACDHGVNGWAIGDEKVPKTIKSQDEKDAKALAKVLLNEVMPVYYEDREKWIQMMQRSIVTTTKAFSVDRMLKEYYDLMYHK